MADKCNQIGSGSREGKVNYPAAKNCWACEQSQDHLWG